MTDFTTLVDLITRKRNLISIPLQAVEIVPNNEELEQLKLVLLYNKEDTPETRAHWQSSFELRKRDFGSNKSTTELLHEWPIIKTSFGDKLVKYAVVSNYSILNAMISDFVRLR